MPKATLSSGFRSILPASVRRELGIWPAARQVVQVAGDRVVIRKPTTSDLEQLAGFRSDLWRGFEAEIDAARDVWDWRAWLPSRRLHVDCRCGKALRFGCSTPRE